jgi:hypothetical protein
MQFINFSSGGYASTTMLSYSPTSLANSDQFLSDTGIAFSPRLEGNNGNVVSFSFWIKPQGSIGELIRWARPTALSSDLVRFNSTSALIAGGATSTGTDSTTISERLAPINDWYHVVFCGRTGASNAGKVMLYINGVQFSSEISHSNAFDIISSLNKIRFFDRYSGKIGSIELWGTYLSQADAVSLYAAGRTESPASILPNARLMYSFPMLSSNVTLNSNTSSVPNGDFELGNTGWNFVNPSDIVAMATMTSGQTTLLFATTTGVLVGMRVVALNNGLPVDTFVTAVTSNTVTLSKAATMTAGTLFTYSANKWVIGTADKYKGTNGLYISSDGGVTSSYLNVTSRVYAYRDVTVPSNTPVVRFRAKYPRDSTDYVRLMVSNTSFVPVAGIEYLPTASGSTVTYPNANILKMGRRLNSSNGDGAPIAIAPRLFKENYVDLSDYAGQTVRLIFAFVCDSATSNAWGAAVDDIMFVGKNKVTGTRYDYVSAIPSSTWAAPVNGSGNRWINITNTSLYVAPASSTTLGYDPGASVSHFYFDHVLDLSRPVFTFKARIGGENNFDGLSVRIVDNTFDSAPIPSGGTQYTGGIATTLATMPLTSLTGGIAKDFYIDLSSYINMLAPNSYSKVRIVFTWQNDAAGQTDTYSALVSNMGFVGNAPVGTSSAEADFIANSISFDDDIP